MALLFADSFDTYVTADITEKWTQIYSALSVAPVIGAYGRRGTQGIKWTVTNLGSQAVAVTLSPGDATCVVGFAFTQTGNFVDMTGSGTGFTIDPSSNAAGLANSLVSIRQSGVPQVTLQINPTGTLSVWRGNSSPVKLGDTSVALSVGVTSYVEFESKIDPSAGTVKVWIDGILVLNLSSQNTRKTGSSSWDEVSIGTMWSASTTTKTWTVDDLYIADGTGSIFNTAKGDTSVDARYATANGNDRNFTPSTGTDDYAVVDEALQNGDTDYLSSSTITDKVSMVFQDLPIPGATIYGVQVCAVSRKTDVGAAGHKALTRISGTDYLGTELGLTSSYSVKRQCWEASPATGVAWTESEFNAAEFGVQKSS